MSTIRLLDKPAHQRAKEQRSEALALVMLQPLAWRTERSKSILNLINVHRSNLSGAEKDRRFARILSWIFHGRALAA